jgi:hypothetical protein
MKSLYPHLKKPSFLVNFSNLFSFPRVSAAVAINLGIPRLF